MRDPLIATPASSITRRLSSIVTRVPFSTRRSTVFIRVPLLCADAGKSGERVKARRMTRTKVFLHILACVVVVKSLWFVCFVCFVLFVDRFFSVIKGDPRTTRNHEIHEISEC